MKKFFIIFMMLLIGASFIFADAPSKTDANGRAVINITTTIGEAFPAYKLKVTGITTSTGTINTDSSAVVTTPTVGVVSITEDDLLSKNATVSFSIVQTKLSRAVVIYNLGVTATDLTMRKDAKGDDYVGSTNDGFHSFTLASDSATPAITTGGIAHAVVSGTNAGTESKGVTITYDGAKVAADSTLATFSCTWTSNADAAPGTYQAEVTLEVSAS